MVWLWFTYMYNDFEKTSLLSKTELIVCVGVVQLLRKHDIRSQGSDTVLFWCENDGFYHDKEMLSLVAS